MNLCRWNTKLTPLLPVCLAVLLSAGCAHSQQVDPYEVLEKHYRAIGQGDSTTTNLVTTYAEGTAIIHNLELEGRFREWQGYSSQIRQESIFPDFVVMRGDNGEYAWRMEADGLLMMEQDTATMNWHKEEVLWSRFEHLNRKSEVFSLLYKGLETIDTMTCHVVEITSSLTSDHTYLYIDTLTYYEIARTIISEGGEFRQYFSDFRDVDGYIYAFRDSTDDVGGPSPLTVITTKLVINPPLHDSIFEPSTDTLADMTFE